MERKSTLEMFLKNENIFFLFKSVMSISLGKSPDFELFFERHGEDPEALECAIDFEKFPKWREINAQYQMYFNNQLN